jgi:hypothetical protein
MGHTVIQSLLIEQVLLPGQKLGGGGILPPLPLGPSSSTGPGVGYIEEHNERLSFSGRTGLYFIEHTELVLKKNFIRYFFCSLPPSRAIRALEADPTGQPHKPTLLIQISKHFQMIFKCP